MVVPVIGQNLSEEETEGWGRGKGRERESGGGIFGWKHKRGTGSNYSACVNYNHFHSCTTGQLIEEKFQCTPPEIINFNHSSRSHLPC